MKAIIQTKGCFGNLKGLTFEVVDIHEGGRISLGIEGNTVDFSFHEVAIVNFQDEMQAATTTKTGIRGQPLQCLQAQKRTCFTMPLKHIETTTKSGLYLLILAQVNPWAFHFHQNQ